VAKIFISYRRETASGIQVVCFDLLSKHFGNAQIFMDIDTIGPGEDYAKVIKKTCESCEVLLAVIGRSWSTRSTKMGIADWMILATLSA